MGRVVTPSTTQRARSILYGRTNVVLWRPAVLRPGRGVFIGLTLGWLLAVGAFLQSVFAVARFYLSTAALFYFRPKCASVLPTVSRQPASGLSGLCAFEAPSQVRLATIQHTQAFGLAYALHNSSIPGFAAPSTCARGSVLRVQANEGVLGT